jgi:hypothetical protein
MATTITVAYPMLYHVTWNRGERSTGIQQSPEGTSRVKSLLDSARLCLTLFVPSRNYVTVLPSVMG